MYTKTDAKPGEMFEKIIKVQNFYLFWGPK